MVEFQVLRCAECQTFQVLQVTKSLKWKCKLCGSKQSVIKVHGRGTGADCRKHVQKLNSLRGELDVLKEEASFSPSASDQFAILSDNLSVQEPRVSRWSKFVEDPAEDIQNTDEEIIGGNMLVTTDRVLYDRERKQTKFNKRKWDFSEDHRLQHATYGKKNREAQRWREDSHVDNSSSSKEDFIPSVYKSNFHVKDNDSLFQNPSLQMQNKPSSHDIKPVSFVSDKYPVNNRMRKHFSDCAAVSAEAKVSGDFMWCKRPSSSAWNEVSKENAVNKTSQPKLKNNIKKVTKFSSTASKWNSFLDDNQSDNNESDEESDLTLSDSGQLAVFLPIVTGSDLTKL